MAETAMRSDREKRQKAQTGIVRKQRMRSQRVQRFLKKTAVRSQPRS